MNGNGLKKKAGRPKSGEGISTKILKKEAIKADGNPKVLAKALDIHPQTAKYHLAKPEIQKVVLSAREINIEKYLPREKIYKNISDGLDANMNTIFMGAPVTTTIPDHDMRLKYTKLSLELRGDLQEAKEGGGSKVVVNMPLVLINNVPMRYDFVNEPDAIES